MTLSGESILVSSLKGILEGAGHRLPFVIDGKKARPDVHMLVAGHGSSFRRGDPVAMDIPVDS